MPHQSPRVAVVGAGPSGLVTASELIEEGAAVDVYESSSKTGGLWRSPGGYMGDWGRTNISRWNCCFSHLPWSPKAADFPGARHVERYLEDYAKTRHVAPRIRYGCPVGGLEYDGATYTLIDADGARRHYDRVVIGAGVFSEPCFPDIAGKSDSGVLEVHSSNLSSVQDQIRGKTLAVVGGSFSGIEAADYAVAQGAKCVRTYFSRPSWILPRVFPIGPEMVLPLDLVFFRRARPAGESVTAEERNRRTFSFFEASLGNPGGIDPALTLKDEGGYNFFAVSDDFLTHVSSGRAEVRSRRVTRVLNGILTDDAGETFSPDIVVWATGFRTTLNFLSQDLQAAIEYQADDLFVPLVADLGVVNARAPGLYFVGMYRGPFFGSIELQARWVARMIAQDLGPGDGHAARLEDERALRRMPEKPQFPHGDYVEFSDKLAGLAGCLPDEGALDEICGYYDFPVTPPQFRLSGPGRSPQLARRELRKLSRFLEDRLGGA